MQTAEIIVIGDELLNGVVRESNSYWLIKTLTRTGFLVRRVAIVSDQIDCITEETSRALEGDCNLIIISGGLGTTQDDVTAEAVATALRRPLAKFNSEVDSMTRKYSSLNEPTVDLELTRIREKPALMPAGSNVLENSLGVAPGFLIELDTNRNLICLPGVPKELKAMFTSFASRVNHGLRRMRLSIELSIKDESIAGKFVRDLSALYPAYYFKTLVKEFGRDQSIWLVAVCYGESKQSLKVVAAHLTEQTEQMILPFGFKVNNARVLVT